MNNPEVRLRKLEASTVGSLRSVLGEVAFLPERPLYPLSTFDLVRFVALLTDGEPSADAWEELGERLVICAPGGVLLRRPDPKELLQAARAELETRNNEPAGNKGRGFKLDGRPDPAGTPGKNGTGFCGLYHVALDRRVAWDAPTADPQGFCPVCKNPPFDPQLPK